ncbi:flagellar biosynthesis protein, FliO [Desulfosporosinus acididurans]|uniref:Flagellar biosynthesis protein, FliO n=1 Tax=Desulfosporosinus acididurans TaxID=476652 RepID=A0A0J1IK35_9FIRM|nr:flagellar biosynthetic protein FliO [Desulfosporosinus acididurans]KLU65046.1 flagellar biosynthesis protein, FliO [Desulfosporosinus acididurans]
MFNQDQSFPSSGSITPVAQAGSSWWGLIGTFVVFLLILLVSLWIIRRLNQAKIRSLNAPWARVLDRQVLSGQQSLYLVEIAGQLQVLGGSDHHLLKLSEINDPEVAAEILEEIASRPVEKVEGWIMNLAKLWRRRHLRRKGIFPEELDRLLEEDEK